MKHVILALTVGLLAVCGSSSAQMGKLYDLSVSPFADDIAHKPGDILTIMVNETARAQDRGDNKLNKKSELDLSLNKFFLPGFNIQEGFSKIMGEGTTPG